MRFKDQPIRRKLALVTLGATILALSLACVGFSLFERASFRATTVSELTTLADTLGANAAASLTFSDKKTAGEILGTLQSEHHILLARLLNDRGQIFAEYHRSHLSLDLKAREPQAEGTYFGSQSITLVREVSLNGGQVGSIVIVSDLGVFHTKLRQYAQVSLLVLFFSALIAYLVSTRLLRVVSAPIVQLADVAERVSMDRNYSLRSQPGNNDEVGRLINSFNQMLEGIEQRDLNLQKAKDELEDRVRDRTADLQQEVLEREQAESEMRRARDVAEEASRAKSEFLANMSHEIRTPLNGVIGMTTLALDTELSSEQREYLETIDLSANTLLTVINDILDFSKIEAGKIELETIDFNLRDCLEETLKTLALRSEEKGLELLCDIAPGVPDWVSGDAVRLRQVILNLVGNAIKFTHRGQIDLRVRRIAETGDAQTLQITVADTGIGIPVEKQTSIFDPFTQADTSTTRNYGGTGLGLTISSRLVSMMGGKIWLKSEVGRGSQFYFTLPLRPGHEASESESKFPIDILRTIRALVVDDNSTNRRILQEMLKDWEVKSTCVEGGEQALAELQSAQQAGQPYQLMLTDLHMPGIDGFTLAEKVRHCTELAGIAIVILTSAGHSGEIERCRSLGITSYLFKPIRKLELLSAVIQVREQGQTPSVAAPPVTPSKPLVQGKGLNILLAEDNRVNQIVATRVLGKMGHTITVANNGLEALSLLAAGSFDLVLMDIQMPQIDGIAATKSIRTGEIRTNSHLPIIAMTAHAMKGDRERCIEAGMDGYVSKPIDIENLEGAIAKVMQLNSTGDGGPSTECHSEGSLRKPINVDFGQILKRLGGDEELFHEVIEIFIDETAKNLDTLRLALAEGDADLVEKKAHSMKGELGYLGIAEVSQKARDLEELGRNKQLDQASQLFASFQPEVSDIIVAMRSARHKTSLSASSGAGQ